MPDNLDIALTDLRSAASDRRLDDLSTHVWSRIDARTAAGGGGLWRWRTAALAFVLLGGAVVSGTAVERPAHDFSPFSVRADFAPSTLLAEGG